MVSINKRLKSRLAVLIAVMLIIVQMAALFSVSVSADASTPPAPGFIDMWAVSVGWSDTGGGYSQYVTADGYNGGDGLAICAPGAGAWGLLYYGMPGTEFIAGATYTLTFMAKTYNLNQAVTGAGVHISDSIWDDGAVKLPNGTDGAWQQIALTGISGTELAALGTAYITVNPSMNTGGYMVIDDVVLTKDGDPANLIPAFSSNFNMPKPTDTVITRDISGWTNWENTAGDFASGAGIVAGGTNGTKCLQFYNDSQFFNMAAVQDVLYLPNGTYTVSIDVLTTWINGAQIQIAGYGGAQIDTNCNAMDTTGTWKTYTQTVTVTTNSMLLKLWGNSNAVNQWLAIDNVRVTLDGGDGTNYATNGSFEDAPASTMPAPGFAGMWASSAGWKVAGGSYTEYVTADGYRGGDGLAICAPGAGAWGLFYYEISGAEFIDTATYTLSLMVKTYNLDQSPAGAGVYVSNDVWGNGTVKLPANSNGAWQQIVISGLSGAALSLMETVYVNINPSMNPGGYMVIDDVVLTRNGDTANLLPAFHSNFNMPKPTETVITREVPGWSNWESTEGDFAGSAGIVAGGTNGTKCLQYYNDSQLFNMAAVQEITNLLNGTYTVSVDLLTSWISGAQMQVDGYGGAQLDTNCNAMDSSTATWKTYTQTVAVTSNAMTLKFWAISDAVNQWLAIDNVRVTLNGGDGTNYAKNGSFEDEAVPSLSSINYLIDSEQTVTGIAPGTSYASFVSQVTVTDGFTCEVKKGGAEVTSGNIGTGMIVNILDGTGVVKNTYIIVIYGDISGDGAVTINDLIMIRKYIVDEFPATDTYIVRAMKTTGNLEDAVGSLSIAAGKKQILGLGDISQLPISE